MNAKITISEECKKILQQSTITDKTLVLPEQLDRKTYTTVNKILKAAGGEWNKSAKAHVFPSDPREILGLALQEGAITDQKKATQAFYTPDDVADLLIKQALEKLSKPLPLCSVLEPSAGQGALLKALKRTSYTRPGLLIACELDASNKEALESQASMVVIGDFLTSDVGNQYDLILMNPPFTGNQYADHMARAWSLLAKGGVMAAIAPISFHTSSVKRVEELRASLGNYSAKPLGAGAFSESGTEVSTILVVAQKPSA